MLNTGTHLLRIVNSLIVNEGEAAGASGPLVVHHIDPRQRAVAGEHLPKVSLRGVQAQAKHPETCVRVGVSLCGVTESASSLFSPLSSLGFESIRTKVWQQQGG